MEHCKHIESLSREGGLKLLKHHRIIAWRESDQGWAGMRYSPRLAMFVLWFRTQDYDA